MGNSTTKSKKLVGFVATATLATSMIAGVGNASAQTTDTLKTAEPVQEKAKDKKEERPESLFPYLDVNYETTIYVGDPFDPMSEVSAYDSKDGDITDKINIVGEVDPFEPGGYNLDYTVTNSRGFSVIKQVHVWVNRGEKPTLRLPYRVSINVGDKFDPMAGVSAIDEKDGDITSKIKVEGNVDTSKPGTYEVTYSVTNSKGLTIVRKQPVKVKETEGTKNEAPVLTVPFSTTLHVGEEFDPMAGVSATDKEDGNLTNKVKYTGSVDTSKPGKYIVEYWVVDSKGVNATATRSVIVKENEEIPDMEPKLTAPIKTTINVGDKFDPMAGVSATDKEDGDITSKVTVNGSVDTSKPGTYELTYTVLDSKGHKVTTKQTVTVKQKVEPKDDVPVLTVPAEATINIGDKFNPMAGVSATDKEDGDITSKVTVDGSVNASKPGTYELTYTVLDSKGHTVIAKQTVTVKQKVETTNEAPVLTVPFTTTLRVGEEFDPMAGVSASDKEDGNLTNKIKYKGNVDTSKPGKYIVEYWVVDSKGVNATATQSVIVKENEETPDMEPKLTVPTRTTINVGDKFNPLSGVNAIDNEDGDITDKVTVDGSVDASKPGTYELTYTVSDSKGHTVTAKQTVTVKQKVESKDEDPVLTVPTEVTLHVGDKYNPLSGVKAIDKEDGDITDKVIHMGEVDTSKAGNFEVKFLVRDASGNEVTATQKVTVKDTDTENGSDNSNNNSNSGNGSDNSSNNTNSGEGPDNSNTTTGNISDNNNTSSNLDNKKDTIKELPKTGASSNNGTAVGILAILAGMLITFGRKFKKAIK
ncbi:cell wall anchor protein [Bacillus toyonensis]|uniref:immunoglobulin-like domain-containing protein n=1 Tax=Bacillus toyonensis TaxID=155322 RepID=UPI000BED4121|nr:immunoglobulin-like domain-containing protein [Bacillus toyonensis]PEC36213.1 cell wall anchor protein [Bacillus toyonensis]PED58271.1 cell wall anchor protein [Bacillus toyonensis]PEN40316.1 cell wall anchor protein [Bacillus toyonensis]PEP57623.1 cell wall anchor protein [Bacillus toyonensis]PFY39411.1 cell wall anchor protein [Bacillus toyonensis]